MLHLLIVSVLWAFSFGLVKGLAGLDPTAVAVIRLALSLGVFLPFFRPGSLTALQMVKFSAIGALQFGAMYVLYLRAYGYLHAYEVALFTITTPLFVTLLDAGLERRWSFRFLLAALLSVAGTAVIVWRSVGTTAILTGCVLVQLSNLCFAAGQIAWRRQKLPEGSVGATVFALPYAGALVLTLAASLFMTHWSAFTPTPGQWATLVYLGVVASGIGFFLWNVGATRVNAGALAAANNAKIPLGVACALLIFGESTNLPRLLLGGSVMALGVWTAGKPRSGEPA